MKKIGICVTAVVGMFMANAVQAEVLLQEKLASKIIEAEQNSSLSAQTRFLTALAQMQQNALHNRLGKDGVVQGAQQVVDNYLALAQNHSELYMLEQQVYLSRRIALGGVHKSITQYLMNAANKKDSRKFKRVKESLNSDKKLFKKHHEVVAAVAAAREALAQMSVDESIAKAQAKQGGMAVAQYQQIDQVLEVLRPLASAMAYADESFWPIFKEGIKADPFELLGGQKLALPEFLAAYGKLSPTLQDGINCANMAARLLGNSPVSSDMEGITAQTQFLEALAKLQQNAIHNRLDQDGVVLGAEQVADSYLALAQKHSDLYMLEQQVYLSRRIALGGVNKTISEYLINAAGKKDVRKFERLAQTLRAHKRLFKKYHAQVSAVAAVRASLGQLSIEENIAKAQAKQGGMSVAQYQQIDQVLEALRPLAGAGIMADESFWAIFSEGIQADPFALLGGKTVALPEFLAAYGRLSSTLQEGMAFTTMGTRLLKK